MSKDVDMMDPATGGMGAGAGGTGVAAPQTAQARPQTPMPTYAPPDAPTSADSRMAGWRSLLTDFVWSLSEGMKARPRGHGAGIGEALQGPWTLESLRLKQQQEQQRIELEKAQAIRTQAASDAAMMKIQQAQAELPLKIQELLSKNALTDARVPLVQAQTANTQATTSNLQARTANTQSDTAQKQFVKVGDKLYTLSSLQAADGSGKVHPIVDATDDIQMTVTKELAEGVGQPELAGQTVTGKVARSLISAFSSATKIIPTAGGVMKENIVTGTSVNEGQPAGVAVVQARPTNIIDQATGLPSVVSAGTAIKQGAIPGTLSDVNKLTGQAASFSNFHSNANRVRELLPAIDNPGASTKIAAAMQQLERIHLSIGVASTGVPAEFAQWLQGQLVTSNLTPQEYDLINALATMREDVFNLRQFFGNSPIRSNQQVSLMMAQLPSVADISTGNSALVARKIDNFERSVMSVEATFGPLMSILKANGGQPASPAPTPTPTPTPTPATGGQVPQFIRQNGRVIPNPALRR